MAPHSPRADKFPDQLFSGLMVAVGPATAGFALGCAWLFVLPGEMSQLVIATMTPVALSAIFFRARD